MELAASYLSTAATEVNITPKQMQFFDVFTRYVLFTL